MPYLDTSVLGSYYCPERLSNAVAKALAAVTDPVISPLVELEFTSLLSLKVRTGDLTAADAGLILSRFRVGLANGSYRAVDLGQPEHDLARDWLARFTTPLRTLDALHLAAAFANGLTIVTTDKPLAAAAAQLGATCQLIR